MSNYLNNHGAKSRFNARRGYKPNSKSDSIPDYILQQKLIKFVTSKLKDTTVKQLKSYLKERWTQESRDTIINQTYKLDGDRLREAMYYVDEADVEALFLFILPSRYKKKKTFDTMMKDVTKLGNFSLEEKDIKSLINKEIKTADLTDPQTCTYILSLSVILLVKNGHTKDFNDYWRILIEEENED